MPIREMSFAKPFFKATLVENEATLALITQQFCSTLPTHRLQ